MFGTAIGYLAGGIIGDKVGIIWPFRVTLGLFLLSCCYVLLFLPWIPKNKAEQQAWTAKGISRLFGPFRIFVPQKWMYPGGSIHTEYGALLLGTGVFLGVLATGYLPILLQLYSTDIFGFGTTENGYLISFYSVLRGLFLMLAFPRIINVGRAWLKRHDDRRGEPAITQNGKPTEDSAIPDLPVEPEQLNTTEAIENEQEPIEPQKLADEKETFAFDLFYSKFSLILDGILTLGATFVNRGWQMYLVAAVLPFAAGTGAAAKGTILQMCVASERTDALSAITLIENLARLSTSKLNPYFNSQCEIRRALQKQVNILANLRRISLQISLLNIESCSLFLATLIHEYNIDIDSNGLRSCLRSFRKHRQKLFSFYRECGK